MSSTFKAAFSENIKLSIRWYDFFQRITNAWTVAKNVSRHVCLINFYYLQNHFVINILEHSYMFLISDRRGKYLLTLHFLPLHATVHKITNGRTFARSFCQMPLLSTNKRMIFRLSAFTLSAPDREVLKS